MAMDKDVAAIWQAVSQAAGATTTSDPVDLRAAYEATISIKNTNGATGPTVAATIQIQVSEDNSEWYNYGGALQATLGNNIVTSWGAIPIPAAVNYVRLVGSTNTGQTVQLDADISYIVGI